MVATARPFSFLANEGLVKIPYYQRAYVWDVNHWDKLLTNLTDSLNSGTNPYLGTIILQKISDKPFGHLMVVDGQQRLTTLCLLLKALYHCLSPEYQEEIRLHNELFRCLYYKKDAIGGTRQVRIEHSKVDRKYFEEIIGSDNLPNEPTDNKIYRCFRHFIDKFNKKELNQRIELFNFLLRPSTEIMVVITLAESDDEQFIFDTMNTAGAKLSGADTIKNYLFRNRTFEADMLSHEEAEALYKKNWEAVFEIDEATVEFWSTVPKTNNHEKHDNIEILLRSMAIIDDYTFRADSLTKTYKEQIDLMNKQQIISLAESISEYAKLFKESIIYINKDKSDFFSYDDYEMRLFHILSEYGVTSFHPYILFLYRTYKDNDPALEAALHKLETMLVRRYICKGYTSNNYASLCKSLIQNPNDRDNIITHNTPSDNDLEKALEYMDTPKVARLVLFWVELYRRHSYGMYSEYADIDLPYIYTLEHIMPKTWETKWSTVRIVDDKGNPHGASSTYGKKYRNRHIHKIGNMTLLRNNRNDALANLDFATKVNGRNGYKRGQRYVRQIAGLRDHAELGITKIDIVTPFNLGDVIWNEERIRTRTSKITNHVKEMWPYACTKVKNKEDELVESIDLTEFVVADEPEVLTISEVVDKPVKPRRLAQKRRAPKRRFSLRKKFR